MNRNKYIFYTIKFTVKDLGSMQVVEKYLEQKIDSVIKNHLSHWDIQHVERKKTVNEAYAKIHMIRKS